MPVLGSRAAGALKAFGFAGLVDIIRDVYFNLVSLLIKGNIGTTVDTVKTIDPPFTFDRSANNFQIANTATQPTKLNPYGGNYYSTYLNGSTDEIYFATANPSLPTATTPFTFETWVYFISFSGLSIGGTNYAGSGPLPFVFQLSGNNTPMMSYYNGSSWTYPVTAPTALSLNTWYHIAQVYTGTTATIYVNGINVASVACTTWQTTGQAGFHVGRRWDTAGSNYVNAYVEDFRLVVGTAVYTSNFTPPTTPLTAIAGTQVLACQNSYFIDNSPNNFAVTVVGAPRTTSFVALTAPTPITITMNPGSGYFNGSTSLLTLPNNANLAFVTNNFTIEMWIYPTYSLSASNICLYNTGSGQFFIQIRSGAFGIGQVGSSENNAFTASLNSYTWQHIAVSRSGTTVYGFLNGVLLSSSSNSVSYGQNGAIIGASGAASQMFTGYISDFRIVNGTALYTATFTLPVSPVSPVTNTQLLTLQHLGGDYLNNKFVDSSPSNSLISVNGDVKQGTFSPYSGNYSIYQSANSTFINATYNANANMVIGTGQFTLEAWIYQPASAPTQYTIVSNRTYNGTGTGTFSLYVIATTNLIRFDELQTPSNITVTTAAISFNTWQHIAVTRDSSNLIRIFVNGVVANTPVTSTFNFSSTNSYQIGYNSDASNYSFIGYLSNVRVSVGTARYTAAFTPPTSPFIPDTATTILIGGSSMLKDMSPNGLAITTTGTPTITRFTPFSPSSLTANTNYFSGSFNGSSDYLLVPYSALFDLSASDWTMEAWFNARSFAAGIVIIAKDTYGVNYDYGLAVLSATSIGTYTAGTAQSILATVPTMSTNTWYHYAISRSGTTTRVYLNGVSYASANQALSNSSATTPTIGCSSYNNPSGYFNGLIYNLRISKSARYTGASFTVPTQPFTPDSTTSLLLFNDTRIIDSSPNNVLVYHPSTSSQPKVVALSPFSTSSLTINKGSAMSPYIVGGSTYYDGTGDYLTIPTNYIYDLNTGTPKWTIECWVYLTGSNAAYRTFISKRATGAQWEIGVNPTNSYMYFYNGTVYLTNISVLNNTWTHCAASYDGSTLRMFVNGVFGYSGAVNAAAGTDGIFIGAITGATQTVTGYIGDIRVTRGTAKYTSNFYPPISTLTNENNTILLINSTNTSAFDSTGQNDFQLVGNAKLSTAQVKYGSSSLYFDGTNSAVAFSNVNPSILIANLPFTIEAWVYITGAPGNNLVYTVMSNYSGATNGALYWWFGISTGTAPLGFATSGTGSLTFAFTTFGSNNGSIYATPTWTYSQWNHVAITRDASNNWYIFFNGTSLTTTAAGSWSNSIDLTVTQANSPITYVGATSGAGGWFNGYMDDVRLSKFARYTSSFSAPSTLPENGPPS